MKVDVAGLVAAAQKLLGLATSAQGLLAEMAPLAADPTSGGAAARLDMASMQLWGAACAQAYSLHKAAGHLILIAQKFGTQEELNAAGLNVLLPGAAVMDDTALATLEPVPLVPPDVRVPIPPGAALSGEGFSQLVHNGSADRGTSFSTTATNNGTAIDSAATSVREVAALVPELWESPVGTAALAGRLNEHVTALNTISDRWFELADEARKHADDYSQTVAATPKPQEFADAHNAFDRATDPVSKSQAGAALGRLEARATGEATRYAGVTEISTSPKAPAAPQVPAGGAGAGGVPVPASAGAASIPHGAAAPAQAQLAKAGAAEAGQAGEGAGQLAQMLPAALGAIGGMAGGMAGMAGQVPQALMQTGQGLAQTASQGLSGLASKKATDAELAKSVGDLRPDELSKAKGAGGSGGGGAGGDTHPAGALGPPVTPSTSHTPPTMPSGAAPPPTPTPAGGSAMGGMGMGMPMSGMMPHGQGGHDGGADRVPADKKVVTPPQPHTEPVTGRVSDRTAAAAEASRTRADTEDDDPPPRGTVLRRITLAPLDSERT